MKFLTLKDTDFKEKKVLVRVDFNVPLDDEGNIIDDKRIKSALPTIKYLVDNRAIVILISHLGRPKGKVVNKLRMNKIAERLSELLGKDVMKLNDCIGQDVEDYISKMVPCEVVLLENLRFHAEEKENEESFAKNLADLADLYVNDAFGTSHRKHASVVAVTKFLPSCVGFLLQREIGILTKVLEQTEHPFIAILGGAKVADKIGFIQSLLKKVDFLLLGGAMSLTFLESKGIDTGKSKIEKDKIELARSLLNEKIILPVDIVVADKFDKNAESKVVDIANMPKDWLGLDIGPKTISLFKEKLKEAKTVVWNGPLGVYEFNKFKKGTIEIAKFLANLKADVVIGGGDSAAVIEELNLTEKVTHVSTGGGAFLEFLEGRELPAIKALKENYEKQKLVFS